MSGIYHIFKTAVMGKLRQIINQLAEVDYVKLYVDLKKSGATKSVFLLDAMRTEKLVDRKIMHKLSMCPNTYYTLCSRLGQKIEHHLLAEIETPRSLLVRKMASLHELVFNNSRVIAVATLKKLEKELISYDLSVDLLSIYKHLKRLSIHTREYTTYEETYKRQLTYVSAMDASETLLFNYFRTYGMYYLQGEDTQRAELEHCRVQLRGLCDQYKSHRLYVCYAVVIIFHRLYVTSNLEEGQDQDLTEDIFRQVNEYFKQYNEDPIYPHYVLLFDFLKLAYYNRYGIHGKVSHLCERFSDDIPQLLCSYSGYTFPSHVLWIFLSNSLRDGVGADLMSQNKVLFLHYEPDTQDVPNYLSYIAYRALCCYYAGEYQEAVTWIQQTFNQMSLRTQVYVQIELKALMALQYVLLDDYDAFVHVVNSLQRLLRVSKKEEVTHLVIFMKILKISMQDHRRNKLESIQELAARMPMPEPGRFSPTSCIEFDKECVKSLAREKVMHY